MKEKENGDFSISYRTRQWKAVGDRFFIDSKILYSVGMKNGRAYLRFAEEKDYYSWCGKLVGFFCGEKGLECLYKGKPENDLVFCRAVANKAVLKMVLRGKITNRRTLSGISSFPTASNLQNFSIPHISPPVTRIRCTTTRTIFRFDFHVRSARRPLPVRDVRQDDLKNSFLKTNNTINTMIKICFTMYRTVRLDCEYDPAETTLKEARKSAVESFLAEARSNASFNGEQEGVSINDVVDCGESV